MDRGEQMPISSHALMQNKGKTPLVIKFVQIKNNSLIAILTTN